MMTDNELKVPSNIAEHREKLAEIIVNDMSVKELRERTKKYLINSYKNSKSTFLSEYWDYFEETYGHCPFQLNSE